MVASVLYTKLNYAKLAKWLPSRKCSKIKGKDFTQFLGALVARLILRETYILLDYFLGVSHGSNT